MRFELQHWPFVGYATQEGYNELGTALPVAAQSHVFSTTQEKDDLVHEQM